MKSVFERNLPMSSEVITLRFFVPFNGSTNTWRGSLGRVMDDREIKEGIKTDKF